MQACIKFCNKHLHSNSQTMIALLLRIHGLISLVEIFIQAGGPNNVPKQCEETYFL